MQGLWLPAFGLSLVQAFRLSGVQDLPDVGSGPFVVCSLPFVRFVALLLVRWLHICPYFAILGGSDGVLWRSCVFVLLACFAWIVGLLCA